MATTPRNGKPYCWVTHITGLLAAEKECLWAPWFRAHFKYDKVQDTTFNTAAWTADHQALVQRRRDELVHDGWLVSLESANDFKLHGQTAIVSGKPDIVARKPGEALVVDCKTGKQRKSDYFQVLIYLVALPKCFRDLHGLTIRGEVCYRDQRITIEPEELNTARRNEIFAILRMVGGDERPTRCASRSECPRCDIGLGDCPDRWVDEPAAEAVMAEF